MNKYFFTFGIGQPLHGFYQEIVAENMGEAEETMIDRWGKNWASGYEESAFYAIDSFKDLKPLETIHTNVDITVGQMREYTKRLKEILNGSDEVRDVRLANLMTDLEQAYSIPFLNDPEWNKKHPNVLQLYRAVSELRRFEEVI